MPSRNHRGLIHRAQHENDNADQIIALLQDRLNSLTDLSLTLKHVHRNVVGPHVIAVHTMLDPQVETVRSMADETAEQIAALGGSPSGTPAALVDQRSWDNYSIGRADAIKHLGALDVVYAGIIEGRRRHSSPSAISGKSTTPWPGWPNACNYPSPTTTPSPPGRASQAAQDSGAASTTATARASGAV
jgi:DNA-binding ferritin-like protein